MIPDLSDHGRSNELMTPLDKNSLVHLVYHDPSGLGTPILVNPYHPKGQRTPQVTPVSVKTVHRPNTTTPYPQVQLSLESSQTQATRHCKESNFIQVSSPVSSLISGMYGAGIRDAVVNRWSQQVSVSAACVGMLSLLDFLELGSSNCQIETTAKRAGIRDAFVVKHYK